MKTCPNCKTEKETTEFYNRRNKKGNSPYCKSCTNTQSMKNIEKKYQNMAKNGERKIKIE